MNEITNNKINSLFISLEAASNHERHFCAQFIKTTSEKYNEIHSESMDSIFTIQKQIVRSLLKAGEIGELLFHIQVGTLPRYIIQASMGRLA